MMLSEKNSATENRVLQRLIFFFFFSSFDEEEKKSVTLINMDYWNVCFVCFEAFCLFWSLLFAFSIDDINVFSSFSLLPTMTSKTTTKAFSLTYVRYPISTASSLSSSILGSKFLAACSLVPISVVIVTAMHCLTRRELFDCSLLVGIVLNEIVAQMLKQFFAMPRPRPACERVDFCDSYGMPSSHAQLAFFHCAFSLLGLLRRMKYAKKQKNNRANDGKMDRISQLLALSTLPVAFLVGLSRVQLGYHDFSQVVAGGLLGAALGTFWYLVTAYRFAKIFKEFVTDDEDSISSSEFMKKLGLFLRENLNMRDSSRCANPLALSRLKVELETSFPAYKEVTFLSYGSKSLGGINMSNKNGNDDDHSKEE